MWKKKTKKTWKWTRGGGGLGFNSAVLYALTFDTVCSSSIKRAVGMYKAGMCAVNLFPN